MFPPAPSPDRRTALKSRSRQAIIEAAAALLSERRGTDFTVEELAQRADVCRRTVFNHFASIDDVVTEVCTAVVGEALTFPEDAGGDSTAFDDLVGVFRDPKFISSVMYLTQLLGRDDPRASPPQTVMAFRAIALVWDQLTADLAARHPHVEEVEIELLVGSFAGGVGAIYQRWCTQTRAADIAESRILWLGLLARLSAALRTGHGAGIPPDPGS